MVNDTFKVVFYLEIQIESDKIGAEKTFNGLSIIVLPPLKKFILFYTY